MRIPKFFSSMRNSPDKHSSVICFAPSRSFGCCIGSAPLSHFTCSAPCFLYPSIPVLFLDSVESNCSPQLLSRSSLWISPLFLSSNPPPIPTVFSVNEWTPITRPTPSTPPFSLQKPWLDCVHFLSTVRLRGVLLGNGLIPPCSSLWHVVWRGVGLAFWCCNESCSGVSSFRFWVSDCHLWDRSTFPANSPLFQFGSWSATQAWNTCPGFIWWLPGKPSGTVGNRRALLPCLLSVLLLSLFLLPPPESCGSSA